LWGVSGDVDSQKTHFKKFDILFGKLRPYFHKVCIAPLDGIASTDILIIEPKKSDYLSFCLNHLYSNELISYVSVIANGTRMPRVDWKSISDYGIVMPPEYLLSQFNEATFSFYGEIIVNNRQSAILAKIRDTLLPKLMNGDIPVGAKNFSPLPAHSTAASIESTQEAP
jgi:type I restriction enzyme S subunit